MKPPPSTQFTRCALLLALVALITAPEKMQATSQKTINLPFWGALSTSTLSTIVGTTLALPEIAIGPFIIHDASLTFVAPNGFQCTATISGLGKTWFAKAHTNSLKADALVFTLTETNGDEPGTALLGMRLESASLTINRQEGPGAQKTLVFDGHARIAGLCIIASLITDCTNGLEHAKTNFSVSLDPETTQDIWHPFSTCGLPVLEEIAVSDIQVGITGTVGQRALTTCPLETLLAQAQASPLGLLGALAIQGTTTLLGTPVTLFLRAGIGPDQAPYLVGGALLPEGWNLAQSFPQLLENRTLVTEALTACKLREAFVICSPTDTTLDVPLRILRLRSQPSQLESLWRARQDERFVGGQAEQVVLGKNRNQQSEQPEPATIQRGIPLQATLGFAENTGNTIVETLMRLCKTPGLPIIRLSGNCDPYNPRNFTLQAALEHETYTLQLGNLELSSPSVAIVATGAPTIGLKTQFFAQPTPQDSPLRLVCTIDFTPTQVALAGSLMGTWENPFGIQGFAFSDLAIMGSQTYEAIAQAIAAGAASNGAGVLRVLIPHDFGLAGGTTLGTGPLATQGRVRARFGTNFTQAGIAIELAHPRTISELVALLLETTTGESLTGISSIPSLPLTDITVHIVPQGTTIGEVQLEQGIGFSAGLDLCGIHASCHGAVDGPHMQAILGGEIQSFAIGPLAFTGSGGTDRLHLNGIIAPTKHSLDVSGRLQVLDILNTALTLHWRPDNSIAFATNTTFGPFQGAIAGHFSSPRDCYLRIAFGADCTRALQMHVNRLNLSLLGNSLGKMLTIHQIAWEGSAHELLAGKLPYVDIDCTVLGKRVHKRFIGFNLRDIPGTLKTIAKALTGSVTQGILGLFARA